MWTSVVFEISHAPACWGQVVKVMGSWDELGNWNSENALALHHTNGGVWRGTVDFQTARLPCSPLEYKYIVSDPQQIIWENLGAPFQNRQLDDVDLSSRVGCGAIVRDAWSHYPHLECRLIERKRDVKEAWVILGRKLQPNGTPSSLLMSRVRQGSQAFLGSPLPLPERIVVLSGGVIQKGLDGNSPSEAQIMQDLALRHGVPSESILLDLDARNTIENGLNVHDLLAQAGVRIVHLVTSDFHLPRALKIFRSLMPLRCGYRIHGCPTTDPLTTIQRIHEEEVERHMIKCLPFHFLEYGLRYSEDTH